MKKLVVILVIFMSIHVHAVQYYDDGLEHDINTSINDSIAIYNGDVHMGPPTTVNLRSGGTIYGAYIYDQSIFNMFAGAETDRIDSHNESHFNVFDGISHVVELYDDSYGIVSGGNLSRFYVWNQSRVSISGGMIDQLDGFANSTINMSDGFVNMMDLHDNSTANISGGNLNTLSSDGNSQILLNNVWIDRGDWGGEGITANDFSDVSMAGGGGFISARGDSTVEISNAVVGLDLQDSAHVTVSDSEIRYLTGFYMNNSLNLINTTYHSDIGLMGSCHLTVSTGTFLNSVGQFGYSTLTLSGGNIGFVQSIDNSFVEINSGEIGALYTYLDCTIEMTGGHVEYLSAEHNSQVDITGGFVAWLDVSGNSQTNISGGDFYGIYARDFSSIVINGFDFNYGYGYITDTSGILTGTLLSGEMINVDFQRLGDAQIFIVPEPTTLLLVGIGAVMVRKRRK